MKCNKMIIFRLQEKIFTKTPEYAEVKSDKDIFSLLQSKRFMSESSAFECLSDTVCQTIEFYGEKTMEAFNALQNIKQKTMFDPVVFKIARNLEHPTLGSNLTTCLGNRSCQAEWVVVEEETDEVIAKENLLSAMTNTATSIENNPSSKIVQAVRTFNESGIFFADVSAQFPRYRYQSQKPVGVQCRLHFPNSSKAIEFLNIVKSTPEE